MATGPVRDKLRIQGELYFSLSFSVFVLYRGPLHSFAIIMYQVLIMCLTRERHPITYGMGFERMDFAVLLSCTWRFQDTGGRDTGIRIWLSRTRQGSQWE